MSSVPSSRVSYFIASLFAGCLGSGLFAQPVPPSRTDVTVRPVLTLYRDLCAVCHGTNWEGVRAPSMLDDEWAHGGDDESLLKSIRDGWIANTMPPFGTQLSELEQRAMVVFIRESREKNKNPRKPAPPDVNGMTFDSKEHPFKIERIVNGLTTPWGIAFLPDGRMIVTERAGRLRIIEIGKGVVETISGLPPVWVRQDGGLFDVILHPNYAQNGWLYLSFSEVGTVAGQSTTRVIRGRIKDGALVDQTDIFKATPEQYWQSNTHFGSRFAFDKAGFLYFTIGDRGRSQLAQDLTSPYGKIHRVKDDGSIPADNPFVNREGAVKSIWSYGNRNVQGITQHPVTGELWATEHGPRGGDELNWIQPGRNYGWPVITYGMNDNGTPITDLTAKEGMEQPITYWTPSPAVAAIEFYTGDKFPKWKGNLFVCSLVDTHLKRLVIDGHKVVSQEIVFRDLGRVRDVITGPDGYLYVSLNSAFQDSPGEIVRLVPNPK